MRVTVLALARLGRSSLFKHIIAGPSGPLGFITNFTRQSSILMPLAGLQRSKPTLKTRAQPKLAHAAIAHSTTPTTTLHPIVQAKLRIGLQRASTCACGGSCPRCQPAVSGLEIGEPNDPYEREADAVADRVIRMVGAASPVAPAEPVLQSKRATNEGKDNDEKLLQTKAESSSPSAQSSPGSSSARCSVHAALSAPGQPLAAETRAFFEPRFGRDLSGVRLHTGAAAERSAREISASAYTVGRDIVFGNGGLDPETPAGRWLMAHAARARPAAGCRRGHGRPALLHLCRGV